MFDIGFSELMVIAIVALIVIGPERLPKVARTLGHLLGRMQRYVNDVKSDISREMELDELRKLQGTIQDAAQSIEQSVSKEIRDTESELQGLSDAVDEKTPGASVETPPVALTPQSDSATSSVTGKTSSQLELDLDSKAETRPQA